MDGGGEDIEPNRKVGLEGEEEGGGEVVEVATIEEEAETGKEMGKEEADLHLLPPSSSFCEEEGKQEEELVECNRKEEGGDYGEERGRPGNTDKVESVTFSAASSAEAEAAWSRREEEEEEIGGGGHLLLQPECQTDGGGAGGGTGEKAVRRRSVDLRKERCFPGGGKGHISILGTDFFIRHLLFPLLR